MKRIIMFIAMAFVVASAYAGPREFDFLNPLQRKNANLGPTGSAVSPGGGARAALRANGARSISAGRAAALSCMAGSAVITPTGCEDPSAICGFVAVPLDHHRPQGPKIQIYFEQYLHTNEGCVFRTMLTADSV